MNRLTTIFILLAVALSLGFGTIGFFAKPVHAQEDSHDAHEEDERGAIDIAEHVDEGQDEHVDEGQDEHAGEEEEEGLVHLAEEELKEFGVETSVAWQGQLDLTLKVPGQVVMPTDRIAHVVPRVPGYVGEVRVGLGDRVKEGQIMAVLDSPALGESKVAYLEAHQELQMAENDWERAKVVHDNVGELLKSLVSLPSLETLESLSSTQAGEYRSLLVSAYSDLSFASENYKREKSLYGKKISSGEEFLAAENEFKKAQAEYASVRDQVAYDVKTTLLQAERSAAVAELALRNAGRQLHVYGIDKQAVADLGAGKEPEEQLTRYFIRAPFNGVVIEQHITRGEVLSDEIDAYVVADLGAVWVDLSVFPKNVNEIAKGAKAIISTGEGLVARGLVTYVSPVVDEKTRSGLARVTLGNSDGLWKPGMFVNGELVIDEVEVQVLIPQTALQKQDGRTVVFVREADAFELRPVVVGRSNEMQAEILSGLNSGEEYVSVGAFALKAHLGKANFGDGHNH